MKKKVIYVTIVFMSLIVSSCQKQVKNVAEKSDTSVGVSVNLDSLKNDENSLVSYTSDTILSVNLELVVLLDPLYQRVRNDSISKTVKDEEEWMSDFRKKLIAYYDTHQVGSDTLSIYEKADSVISVAEQLYEIDDDWSTMGMLVRNAINYTFGVFKGYNLLSQMLASCDDADTKELIYQEWALYEKMLPLMRAVSANIVFLNYWEGSIVGPISSAQSCQIIETRREIFSELVKLCKGEAYSLKNGVYLEHAEKLLFDSLDRAIKESVKSQLEVRKEEGDSGWGRESFMETAKTAEAETLKMKPLIRQWVQLWNQLDNRITHDSTRHAAERIASAMLLQWASIVTSE